jgi:hypothetical protein
MVNLKAFKNPLPLAVTEPPNPSLQYAKVALKTA